MHLLIANDHDDSRMSLKIMLEMKGYSVTDCCDGLHAVDEVRKNLGDSQSDPIRCLLLDLAMPDLSGFEVLGKVRDIGYDGPIVFVTCNGDSFAKGRARNLRAYLWAMPLDNSIVIAKLEELLETGEIGAEPV